MTKAYEKRMLRVLEYIHDNPAADLSLDALAEVAAMSRFHWHRVFHAVTGETCAQATRRIRLARGAAWLLQTELPISEVVKKCGYVNEQSFARSFRSAYGQSPSVFRQTKPSIPTDKPLQRGIFTMFPVEIKQTPKRRMAMMDHTGAYMNISAAFTQVATIIGGAGLFPKTSEMVGIYYDDPQAVPEDKLRSKAGVTLIDDTPIPEGLHEVVMESGRSVVLRFKGPYAGLQAAYQYLYGVWIPENNPEIGDFPAYEVYLNDPTRVAPEELLTDICVGLR